MKPKIYVLAFNQREAAQWATEQELNLRDIVYVHSASVLPYHNRKGEDLIVELPGFAKKRGTFAIQDRLKSLTRRGKFEVEKWYLDPDGVFAEVSPEPVDPAPFDLNDFVEVDRPTGEPGQYDANDFGDFEGGFIPSGEAEVTNDTGLPELTLTEDQLRAVGASDDEVETLKPVTAGIGDEAGPVELPRNELVRKAVEMEAEFDLGDSSILDAPDQKTDDFIAGVAENLAEPKSVAPVRRARRNNQQIAYDNAKAAYDADASNEANEQRFVAATEALRARDPEDERLAPGPNPDDLDF